MTVPAPPTLTPAPSPAPTRADPANFRPRADAYHTWLVPHVNTELPAVLTWMTERQNDVQLSTQEAQSAALAATSAANASIWVSGQTYAIGAVRFSPINFLSYRRKTAGEGTTDPSLDATNWAQVAGTGDVSLTGTQTLTNKTLTNPVINGLTGDSSVINFGSGQFYKDSSGNVGIGTSSPDAKLDVKIAQLGSTAGNSVLAARLNGDANGNSDFLDAVHLRSSNGTGWTTSEWRIRRNIDGSAAQGAIGFGGNNTVLMYTAGSERARIDSSGNLLMTGGGALGYGTGSGGTVTQATSKTTAVTLNKPAGRIVMNSAALAANTNVNFQLNNSLITQSDTLVCSIQEATGGVVYTVQAYCGTGFAQILVRNTGGSSLSEAVAINFAIIKGAIS